MHQVLVIGSGGREHALSWKLSQSSSVKSVYVSPGNAGTLDNEKTTNIALDIKDHHAVATWCKEKKIDLVVVGPEDPLAAGIVDSLKDAGIACFGPSAKAVQLEASKAFAKSFMDRHDIPTARWQAFTDSDDACKFIENAPYQALVVKASGLAAGKGVVVCNTRDEACKTTRQIMQDKTFGKAGDTVVIEELLDGEEISMLAFSDGTTIACFPPAQDHKRLLDGDTGPNTGGMGAYCPCPQVSDEQLNMIRNKIMLKTVLGMKEDGIPYIGVLYAGLMMTRDGPKVLEYNCRFGDPEAQVILPLLKSDLYLTLMHVIDGTLGKNSLEFDDCHVAGVVSVSGGYPGSYPKGVKITGLEKVKSRTDVIIFHSGTAYKDGDLVTNGGRVLVSVALSNNLSQAIESAQSVANLILFEGAYHRRDIGKRALRWTKASLSYSDSGVDIQAGDDLVQSIKPLAKSTSRSGCSVELGMFGGMFDPKAAGYDDPVLVSGTDGVGTKLKIAHQCKIHNTVGIDLVAMCVNDVLAHGAEPLFFLDYFACGKLDIVTAKDVIEGIANGCKMAGCALIGGETAEMPGMYKDGEYDLAGFTVGAVERHISLPRLTDIRPGDVVIGFASSGIHSNGFSLVRKIVERYKLEYSQPCPYDSEKTLGAALLTPTRIYSKSLVPVLRSGKVKAFAHITGGGLTENIPRVLPKGLGVNLDAKNWDILPVFSWIYSQGNVSVEEMSRTFNCGIGGALIVSQDNRDIVLDEISQTGEKATVIGTVVTRQDNPVRIDHLEQQLIQGQTNVKVIDDTPSRKVKVAVLISGTGTNLKALIDHAKDPAFSSAAEIVLVISNVDGVLGLERAKKAGIPTKVIKHQDFKKRIDFDMEIDRVLQSSGVELICLAGFMRILTEHFTSKWEGRLLNIHPSLLPLFKGHQAHKMVLEAGVRISGCSVHFVTAEVDSGAIITQESVPVYPDDTEDTLSERVKSVERIAFPKALELVASGKARMDVKENKVIWS